MVTIRSRDQVAAHIERQIRVGTPRIVGAELEWLVVDPAAPRVRPALDRVAAALGSTPDGTSLPGGSIVTTEPGGQLELSSLPRGGPAPAVDGLRVDVDTVRARLSRAGLALSGMGADPLRRPVRLIQSPRYSVMEAHYRRLGEPCATAGSVMMCSTAAVQVSLDAGTVGTGVQSTSARWGRAHALGPALVAAFACSPLLEGAPTGWRSTRQRTWIDLDPSRTRAPAPELGPVEAMTELALGAQVMTVRDESGYCRPAPSGLTFDDWIVSGTPDEDDLAYHLTTLFPPVRLRGWLELRYLDMLPDPLWQVPVAVATALLDDDAAAEVALAACEPVAGRWHDAARLATGDPALAGAARECLLAAADALPRLGAAGLALEVLAYAERYTARGRCPADDLLDAHRAGTPVEQLIVHDARAAA